MRKVAIFLAGVLLSLPLAGLAVGQGVGLPGVVAPLAVTVEQSIPTNVEVVFAHDGETSTATAPVTVGVSLRLTFDGVAAVAVADSVPVVAVQPVEADGDDALDATGRSFTVEAADGLSVAGLRASVDSLGRLRLLGEVTTTGADDAYFVRATVSFYDASGALVGVGEADTSPRTIAPGKTAPFDLVAEVDADEVVRYRVSVE